MRYTIVVSLALILMSLTLTPDILTAQSSSQQSQVQATPNRDSLPDILTTLNIWVTILSIFLAIALASVGIMSFVQYRQGKHITESLVLKTEAELRALEQKYHLAVLKPPHEILDDARKEVRRDYEPLIEALRSDLKKSYAEMNQRLNDHAAHAKTTHDNNLRELRRLQHIIDQLLTRTKGVDIDIPNNNQV